MKEVLKTIPEDFIVLCHHGFAAVSYIKGR
jgi:hypothetical protein